MGKWSGTMVELGRRSNLSSNFHISNSFGIDGVLHVASFNHLDTRGSFRKVVPFADDSIKIDFSICQVNISSNLKAGTIRGLHYQAEPLLESKLVSCVRGEVFDVLLDMRPNSETFGKHISFNLTPTSGSILVPPLVAHGFQTLEDKTDILYLHSNHYDARYSNGINPMDPFLGVAWPLLVSAISESDKRLPNFSEVIH